MIFVLYVDDEEPLLNIGKLFLEKSGEYNVDVMTSAVDALEKLKSTPYDAIVSDYQMPAMDGIEFLKIVRKEYPALPFIIFTGKGREDIAIEAFENGADFYVQKGGEPHPQFSDLSRKISIAVKHQHAEKALKESEEKYRNLVERASDGILVIQDGIVRYCNQYLADLVGKSVKKIQGKSIFKFRTPEECPKLHDSYKRRMAGEPVPGMYETTLKRMDGSRVFIEINAGIIVYEGKPADLVIIRDITQRKQMEAELLDKNNALHVAHDEINATVEELRKNYDELKRQEVALRASEEKFRDLYDNAPIATYTVDADGGITRANHQAGILFGIPEKKLPGKQIFDFFADTPNGKTKSRAIFKQFWNGGAVVNEELQVQQASGNRVWVSLTATAVRDSFGKIIESQSMAVDITERKRVEGALRQANKQLNLLSNITRHDILNQILALKGYLELSGEYKSDPARLADFIQKGQLAASTIESQIALTREYQEMGVKEPVWQNVNTIVQQMSAILPLKNVRVEVDRQDPQVFADPLFERVIYNLIDNALRYAGNQLTTIRFSSHESDGDLILVCEDDGMGISHEDKKHLFSRGFGKHTGLGLFLSREILTITGIAITETGTPGKGVRFEITVPKGMYRFTD